MADDRGNTTVNGDLKTSKVFQSSKNIFPQLEKVSEFSFQVPVDFYTKQTGYLKKYNQNVCCYSEEDQKLLENVINQNFLPGAEKIGCVFYVKKAQSLEICVPLFQQIGIHVGDIHGLYLVSLLHPKKLPDGYTYSLREKVLQQSMKRWSTPVFDNTGSCTKIVEAVFDEDKKMPEGDYVIFFI